MINQWLYNFDLNRTVLMSDAAGGRTMENTVNYLLSECSWGYVCNNAEAELSETTNRQSVGDSVVSTNSMIFTLFISSGSVFPLHQVLRHPLQLLRN